VKEPARRFGSEFSRHDGSVRSSRAARVSQTPALAKPAHLSRDPVPIGTRSRDRGAKGTDV
jgi:hypothetical protein